MLNTIFQKESPASSAPSAAVSVISSYHARVHPPEGFYWIGNGIISYPIKKSRRFIHLPLSGMLCF